jgi:hypothetical protein
MRKQILEISRKLEAHYIDTETAKSELLNLFSVSESAITEIDKMTHDYNHKIDVAGNTNEQNIIAEAKRDALDEALTIIKKHSR